MARSMNEIRAKRSPEVLERTRALTQTLKDEMVLHELRQAKKITQEQISTILNVNQGSISKLEKRTDMYISTLRSYIAAMGGSLEIKAVFPEGEVTIKQFSEANTEKEDLKLA